MKLSLVIPFMPIDDGKYKVLEDTCKSFIGADEIIIVHNMGLGYAKPINLGLKVAKGDFLMVSNDDMQYDGGSLKRLCDEKAVVSPKVNGKSQPFWGCSFCIPRWVYEKVGGLYEGYRISYFDDEDFYQTLKKADIPMYCNERVNVFTEGGRTLHKFSDHKDFFEENRKKFIERWGYDPSISR